ncbi:MAG: 2Fe-2S iron-sulfur cluster-binding protein [Phycisphaeraceae bacterium]
MFVQTIIMYLGVAIVALVALQALFQLFTGFVRLRRESSRQNLSMRLLQERIEAARAKRAKVEKEVAGWNGWRKFEVVKKAPEPGDICSFYLRPHDGKPLPGFKPGQYLTFQVPVAGKDKPVVRCYSLSDGPRDDYYRVSIKRVPGPKDKPDIPPGLISGHFHAHVNEGDILDVKAPGGHFFLDMEAAGPIVLIGGGIGITPVLSMLNALIAGGTLKREVHFFLGVRNSKEHPFKAHLEEIARHHDKLRLHVCYSNPADNDAADRDYQHAERVSVELFKRVLPSSNYDYYLCGPPPLMESVVPALEAWGVPEASIHYEAFGPATVKKVKKVEEAPRADGAAAPAGIEVTFAKSGKTCTWSQAIGTLLELAEKNSVTMDFGCRAGNCGTCITAIKEGDVTYSTEPGAPPEKGSCLTCVAVPKTRLVLDA